MTVDLGKNIAYIHFKIQSVRIVCISIIFKILICRLLHKNGSKLKKSLAINQIAFVKFLFHSVFIKAILPEQHSIQYRHLTTAMSHNSNTIKTWSGLKSRLLNVKKSLSTLFILFVKKTVKNGFNYGHVLVYSKRCGVWGYLQCSKGIFWKSRDHFIAICWHHWLFHTDEL